MARIIEIYREAKVGLPTQFVVGTAVVADSPVVDSISFYETGAFGGKAFRGPCYVVAFKDTNVRRVITAGQVVDIAWEGDEKQKNVKLKAPELE